MTGIQYSTRRTDATDPAILGHQAFGSLHLAPPALANGKGARSAQKTAGK
jgi:hypothetical protein